MDYYKDIIALYRKQATCVCFLGEGANTDVEHDELRMIVKYAHLQGLKTCLYSGRDVDVEEWMRIFDYIKLGSYIEELGGLDSVTTNQIFLQKTGGAFVQRNDMFHKY